MSADNRRAIAGLTALSVYAIAYYIGFGNWPSLELREVLEMPANNLSLVFVCPKSV
jgi:hypothetical protein